MHAKNAVDVRLCNVAVYYRDIPLMLSLMVHNDGKMSLSKNGVMVVDGHSCPRLTLHIDSSGNEATDKKRLNKLLDLLEELETNNQIISFSTNSSRWK